MKRIAVIDHGMGNLHSVQKALMYVADGAKVQLTDRVEDLFAADRVVLPGQGAMRGCMRRLQDTGLAEAIKELVRCRPFLAICIGPQLLMEFSEENGGVEGLAVFAGSVRRFDFSAEAGKDLKIPHMGWNQVRQLRGHALWKGIADDAFFYFVHSYYLDPVCSDAVVGVCQYGIRFPAMFASENVFASQAHPEKSGACGLQLLNNFVHWSV